MHIMILMFSTADLAEWITAGCKNTPQKRNDPWLVYLFDNVQSRVISVLSWYLTSLVNLSFYRVDASCFLIEIHPVPQSFHHSLHLSHQQEVLLCRNISLNGRRASCFSAHDICSLQPFASSISAPSLETITFVCITIFAYFLPFAKIPLLSAFAFLISFGLNGSNFLDRSFLLYYLQLFALCCLLRDLGRLLCIEPYKVTCTLVSPLCVYKISQENDKINMGN